MSIMARHAKRRRRYALPPSRRSRAAHARRAASYIDGDGDRDRGTRGGQNGRYGDDVTFAPRNHHATHHVVT